ncbi:hypothetical protein V500_04764 [Pseudogymnoascus sp. VKM F-4518 (FW-2643)]|nr:hypothetical protein V500_04764 [Pseudogymnoascus sp. VKM F-4518 (FW-2643)]
MAAEASSTLKTEGSSGAPIATSNTSPTPVEATAVPEHGVPLREYRITHASKHRDYILHMSTPTSSNPVITHYVGNSNAIGKPAVKLRLGDTKEGRLLGVAIFVPLSNNIDIGFGEDPENLSTTTWERLENLSTSANTYRMKVGLGDSSRTVLWKRTHSPEGSSEASIFSKMSMQHLKLVDEATGGLLATYTNHIGLSRKNKGTIRIWDDTGDEAWIQTVLLTALAIIERNGRM